MEVMTIKMMLLTIITLPYNYNHKYFSLLYCYITKIFSGLYLAKFLNISANFYLFRVEIVSREFFYSVDIH